MTTITKEWLQKTITSIESARDEMPFGLDEDQSNMLTAFKIALASLEAKPIGAFHIAEQQVDGTSDYLKDGEWPIDNGIIEVYAASPMTVVLNDVSGPLALAYKELTPAIMRNHIAVFERYGITPNDSITTIHALRIALDGIERSDAMLHAGNFRENKNSSTNNFREIPETSTNYPVTPGGWISCSERMPDTKTAVLVAKEFDRKGDWRMKWATYIPEHPDANDGWIIPGASWKPSHWMPLPEPPL
ncbi:TPA: DUF551 domain-containing protein [Escherichia coli]|nr:DUF551 domain-containing protein [Escherichia coli]